MRLFLFRRQGWVSSVAVSMLASFTSVASAADIVLGSRVSEPPELPNAVLHVNVERLKTIVAETPGAQAIAKDAKVLDVVALLDEHSLQPVWEFGEVTMSDVPTLEEVVKAEGGYIDEIAGAPAAWLPRETYLLPAGNDGLIVVRPADRQLLSRWLTRRQREAMPAYLQDALRQASGECAVFAALDAEGAVSRRAVRERLATVPALANNEEALDQMADLFASVRGLRFEISAAQPPQAKFSIDFGISPAPLQLVAKPFLKEALDRRDLSIEGFDAWTSKIEGNTVIFEGPAAESTIDGILSIFTLPSRSRTVESAVDVAEKVAMEGADPVATATKTYFEAVNSTVEKVRRHSAQTTGSRAAWNDKMARQIDQLSTLNVDSDVVSWGAQTAELLRSSGSTIRNANIQAGAEKARSRVADNVYAQGSYGTNYFGYVDRYGYYAGYYNPNSADTYDRAVDAQARAVGMQNYRESLKQIDSATAQVRRLITERYQIQF